MQKKKILAIGIVISIAAAIVAIWWPRAEQKYDRSEPIHTWQSYSASPVGIHEWMTNNAAYSIQRESDVSDDFRSGYAFINNGALIFRDKGNGDQYRRVLGTFYVKERSSKTPTRRFATATHIFDANFQDAVVEACVRFKTRSCQGIKIHPGTYPYVYAESNGAVLVVTNFGDALLFKGGEWCRMQMERDIYECRSKDVPTLEEPRRVQFYSSIVYRGQTLVGEWPTGRLYEFDGRKLAPSGLTPPTIAEAGAVGYEAQSMAMYCGDLFVGYWPQGEIYRLDGETNQWSIFARLFDGVTNGDFIPFVNRVKKEDDREHAGFYGQRVTALVPYEDSLYAVTSNLNDWSRDIRSPVLTKDQIKRYGAVYRIFQSGCRTIYLND